VARGHRTIVDALLTAAGVTSIAALFLPIAFDVAPLDVGLERSDYLRDFWRLAIPAFPPVLIFGASWRWMVSVVFSRAEQAIMYAFSAAMVLVTLSILFQSAWEVPRGVIIRDLTNLVVIGVTLAALIVG
jgi:hypothetical protein